MPELTAKRLLKLGSLCASCIKGKLLFETNPFLE
jgi:hypothetical protein